MLEHTTTGPSTGDWRIWVLYTLIVIVPPICQTLNKLADKGKTDGD